MDGRRVLVTGGAGFIGSNLANHLAADNEVIAVDDGYLGTPANLSADVEFVERSVVGEELPTDVDCVFHLAALSSRQMHEENPTRGARVNVEGFVNTVEQARRDGCETVVYASTSSIYSGKPRPSAESLDVEAATGYEASKLARERYAEYYHNFHDLSLAGMRFFAVYEGYDGAEAHKDDYANLVTQFADSLAAGESPEIWGDGTQTRDFTHVDDVVRALVAAADHELNGIYNVGTGRETSLNELVELLNAALGTDIDPRYTEMPIENYVYHTRADHSKLTDAVGWEPQVSLEDGIERVCAAYE
ncbi:MAG: NAD-dependent epimerase/dehydratase family protein [Halobaculum sp.]